jgi:hypothetical protein
MNSFAANFGHSMSAHSFQVCRALLTRHSKPVRVLLVRQVINWGFVNFDASGCFNRLDNLAEMPAGSSGVYLGRSSGEFVRDRGSQPRRLAGKGRKGPMVAVFNHPTMGISPCRSIWLTLGPLTSTQRPLELCANQELGQIWKELRIKNHPWSDIGDSF